MQEVLSRLALQDPLTGLPNRAALLTHLERSLAACARSGHNLAVLFIDLDGFKQVNDSLGHATGDELLVRASERITACLRREDVVARLGGDDFVVVCASVLDPATVQGIAARIGSQLALPFRIGERDVVVSASIGIATSAGGRSTAEDMLRQSDLAMYEAKLSGKARTTVFDESMQRAVDAKHALRGALGHAVSRHELRLQYQPIVSLADGRVTGVEALVRWDRPGFGLLLPQDFIGIAEAGPLIAAVDCWVIREACQRGVAWCAAGGTIAVKLSAWSLEHDEVVSTLSQALHRTGISPHQVGLEITEATLHGGTVSTNRNLGCVREFGVTLSIDDFGRGNSSLSQLLGSHLDRLKIDESFVSRMDEDEASATIVGAIIATGHALGLTLVAEGVERQSQASLLREQGCDAAQGFLFGHAVPAEEIDRLFELPTPADDAG